MMQRVKLTSQELQFGESNWSRFNRFLDGLLKLMYWIIVLPASALVLMGLGLLCRFIWHCLNRGWNAF